MLTRILLIALLALPVAAQEKAPERRDAERRIYKVDYVIVEMEGGKRGEARDYSMVTEQDQPGRIRIGTRVPIATGTRDGGVTQWQYMDVGVNIDARASHLSDTAMRLNTKLEATSVVAGQAAGQQPTTRQFRTENDTVVPFGKPTTLFTLDEPGSKRGYLIQVTVTPVRQP